MQSNAQMKVKLTAGIESAQEKVGVSAVESQTLSPESLAMEEIYRSYSPHSELKGDAEFQCRYFNQQLANYIKTKQEVNFVQIFKYLQLGILVAREQSKKFLTYLKNSTQEIHRLKLELQKYGTIRSEWSAGLTEQSLKIQYLDEKFNMICSAKNFTPLDIIALKAIAKMLPSMNRMLKDILTSTLNLKLISYISNFHKIDFAELLVHLRTEQLSALKHADQCYELLSINIDKITELKGLLKANILQQSLKQKMQASSLEKTTNSNISTKNFEKIGRKSQHMPFFQRMLLTQGLPTIPEGLDEGNRMKNKLEK